MNVNKVKTSPNGSVRLALIGIIPAAITAFATAYVTLKNASNDVKKLSENVDDANSRIRELEKVPVGAIIAWWGDWSDTASRPFGFELCDGSSVSTPGSMLGSKPDLRERFVMGAKGGVLDVVASQKEGGTNLHSNLRVASYALTISDIPSHNHGGFTAIDGVHIHETSGRSASDDGGGSDTHFALGDQNSPRRWTGISVERRGSNHQHVINSTGGGKGHDHSVGPFDNRPSHIQVLYLIRVK